MNVEEPNAEESTLLTCENLDTPMDNIVLAEPLGLIRLDVNWDSLLDDLLGGAINPRKEDI